MSEHTLKLFDPSEGSLWLRETKRPLRTPMPTVAVIGAGISGLAAARTLVEHGFEVTVFDKGRGPGGRMSTRRTDTGFHFDHGAQYFTAKNEHFRRYVEAWHDSGVVEKWDGRIVELDGGEIIERDSSDRFVGVPGMNAVCKHLARELHVVVRTRIEELKCGERWELTASESAVGKFDSVIVAIPPPQACELLNFSKHLTRQIASVAVAPCWATMLSFRDNIDVPADGAFVKNSLISWIARDSSKPSREIDADCWVVHASPEWSSANIELEPIEVQDCVLTEFFKVTGAKKQEPLHAVAHRWRYATPTDYLQSGFLSDGNTSLIVCGDWCLGNRVEAAFLSGPSAADAMMRSVFTDSAASP